MQSVCKLLRQKHISKYKYNELDKLNSMQDKQSEHSLMSLTNYIDMYCWVNLLYNRIVFSMKIIVFNDNHYLVSAIYQLNSNISKNSFIS